MESLVLVNQAALSVKCVELDKAEQTLERASALADRRKDTIRQAEVLKLRGMITRDRGDARRAVTLLESAQELALESGETLLYAEAMLELGDTWMRIDEAARARSLWEQARSYFRELGAVMQSVAVERRLVATTRGLGDAPVEEVA